MDDEIIAAAVTEHNAGRPVTDLQARVIASAWHGGQTSALYSFASCGNTTQRNDLHPAEELLGELHHEVRICVDENRAELRALISYVERVGARGPVDTWDRLSW